MTLTHYTEYKDSGVDWLGDVPSHWEVYPHRNLFKEVIERGYPDEEMLSVTISQGVIQQVQLLANSSKKDSSNVDKSNYKFVSEGDIAYNKMRAWQGAIGASAYRGIISPAYIIVRLREEQHNIWYFHYLFRTLLFTTEAERWSYGITSDQWSLRYGEFKQIYSPVPPPDEQAAIVTFLDAAEKGIRRYIRAKQKLIKLLNEQKQAIIQQAVTRGLDPDVPMKDSGIEWLGEIPAHYHQTKLNRLCISIRDGTHNPPPAVNGVYRLLSVRNIIDGNFITRPDDRTMSHEAFLELQRSYTVTKDDVVLALVGATTGKSAVVEPMENVSVQRSIGIIRPNINLLDSHYLNLLIRSPIIQNQIKQIMGKYAAQPGIYLNDVANLQVIFPDITEQKKIVDAVYREEEPFKKSASIIANQINSIREYRTRLIADVVTGKVDVRGLAFEMPEAFAEDDLLDVDEDELLDEEDVITEEDV